MNRSFPKALGAFLALSGAAFPCGPAEFCAAVPEAESFTVIRGTTETWLVGEFTGPIGCSEIVIDSIVTKRETRQVADDVVLSILDPGVRGVYWNYPQVKLDSASAQSCRRTTRQRIIASIPSQTYTPICYDNLGSWCGALQAPIDTLYSCHAGTCEVVPLKTVEAHQAEGCLLGALPPFPTFEDALAYLEGRFQVAQERMVLTNIPRIRIITPDLAEPLVAARSKCVIIEPIADTIAARSLQVVADADPRIAREGSFYFPLGSFGPWAPGAVPANLAYPTPASVGDTYLQDTLWYSVDDLRHGPNATSTRTLAYATGKRTYQYRASTTAFVPCGPSRTVPTRLHDTLLLSGTPLRVTNANGDQCAQADVDVQAGRYSRWLVLSPDTTTPFQTAFRHTFSPENGNSWPIVDDTVLVRNQKVPLAAFLQAVSSIHPRTPRSGFRVSVRGRTLSIELPEASTLEILSPSGRTLSRQELSAGLSVVAVPSGTHGILIARAAGRSVPVLAP